MNLESTTTTKGGYFLGEEFRKRRECPYIEGVSNRFSPRRLVSGLDGSMKGFIRGICLALPSSFLDLEDISGASGSATIGSPELLS